MRRRGLFYGWYVVLAVTLITTLGNGLAGFTFGLFVVPMSMDLGVQRGLIGWLPTARLAANSGASLLLGPLVDKHGARILLALAAALAAATLFGISRAPSYGVVLALFFVLGVVDFSAPGHVLTAVPVAKWFTRLRGQAIGVIGIGIAAGGILYSILHQYLIDTLDWRGAFAISALIIAAGAVPLALIFMRRQPEDMGLLPDGAETERTRSATVTDEGWQWTLREALRTSALWKLVAAYAMLNFAVAGVIVNRAGLWDDAELGGGVISAAYALDSFAFGFGAMGSGILVRRVPSRMIAATASTIQVFAIAATITWVNAPSAIISSMIFGIGGGSSVTLQTVLWAEYFGRAFLGSIRGFVFPVTMIGFGLGPPTIALMYDASGGSYVGGFWLSVGIMVVMVGLLLWARPPRKERAEVRAS